MASSTSFNLLGWKDLENHNLHKLDRQAGSQPLSCSLSSIMNEFSKAGKYCSYIFISYKYSENTGYIKDSKYLPIYLWSLINIYLFTYCKNKALNKLKILLNIEEVFFYFRDRKCIMTMIWKIKKIEFKTLKEKWCNIMKFINKLWQRQSRKLNSNIKLCQNKIWLILYNLNTEFF